MVVKAFQLPIKITIHRTLGDCWVLNFYYLLNVDWDVTWDEIWIRCEHHEDTTSSAQSASVGQQFYGRLGHHAVKEPNSRLVPLNY